MARSLKVPASAFSADAHGDGNVTRRARQEKRSWQEDRGVQGNQTATIVRKTESGGASYAWVEPTYTAVAGLTDLSVAVYNDIKKLERRFGAIIEAGDTEFVFYNVVVVPTDIIQYDGDNYKCVDGTVDVDVESGRCGVVARLQGTS